ncbi:MAG TPA: GspH/FimT family pseudopilin [Blastocatellia bacterium]|nr:GspH/FimT family pseudopilin [Blastocatellia bacterium]
MKDCRNHPLRRRNSEAYDASRGRGMMEVIVGLLVVMIVGSLFVHIVRLGYQVYQLNSATGTVAEQLNKAREIAIRQNRKVSVVFDEEKNQYGIDLNGNGKLDGGEGEDMPEGIAISDSTVIVFLPSGGLPPKTKDPHIVITNSRNSRSISVSSMGAVSVE